MRARHKDRARGGGNGRGMERGRGLLDEADDHPNLRQMAGDGTPVSQRRVKSATPSLLFSATSADVCFVTSFRYQDLPPNYSSDLLRRMKNEKERTTKIGYV